MVRYPCGPEPVSDTVGYRQSEEIAAQLGTVFLFRKCAVMSTQMNYIDVDGSVSFHISFEKISLYLKYRYIAQPNVELANTHASPSNDTQ